MCVLDGSETARKKNIYMYRISQKLWSVGGSCQRHCTQLSRHQNRPNPNATETNTPVYLHVAEYKLITCRFNSGHQGSSLSFYVFRPL